MRVMVTGASGFVGAHTARALIEAGHEVVALVRNQQRLDDAMASFGLDAPTSVIGDMVDADAVGVALEGVDAVVHCAAVVSLDVRDDDVMSTVNPKGLQTVVGLAIERGIDPILYTSSTSALFDPELGRVSELSEPTKWNQPYARSKAACERIARAYQDDGAPLIITYPSGILGPAAGSALGETSEAVSSFISTGFMPTNRGSLSIIDVRDLADAQVALLEQGSGQGPRRVMCGGTLHTMYDVAELLRELTGRRFPIPPVPPALLRGAGRTLDKVGKRLPLHLPLTEEAMTIATRWQGSDDSTLYELGLSMHEPLDTMRDSLRAWREAGLVTQNHLGTFEQPTGTPLGGSGKGAMTTPPKGNIFSAFQVPGWVVASRPFRAVAPKVVPGMHRLILKVSGGRTMLSTAAQPMLMLRTVGAKSGQQRETPLATIPQDDGHFFVVGSNFARASHPAWTHNLLANPNATIVFSGETIDVSARLLDSVESKERWPELLAWFPGWKDYTEVTDREFRIFELSPRSIDLRTP